MAREFYVVELEKPVFLVVFFMLFLFQHKTHLTFSSRVFFIIYFFFSSLLPRVSLILFVLFFCCVFPDEIVSINLIRHFLKYYHEFDFIAPSFPLPHSTIWLLNLNLLSSGSMDCWFSPHTNSQKSSF